MEKTMIELEDSDYAFVLDEDGRLKEAYFPNDNEDRIVPKTIEKVMKILVKGLK